MIWKNMEMQEVEKIKNIKRQIGFSTENKKRTTKGKIEFIAHCNEIRIKGELFFLRVRNSIKGRKHFQKGRYAPTNISDSLKVLSNLSVCKLIYWLISFKRRFIFCFIVISK